MQTVNIPNAYEDDRFDPKVDEDMGFKHKTILCMPIKNSSGQIIGVIQVSKLPTVITIVVKSRIHEFNLFYVPTRTVGE